jgi:hypothetical protein
MISAHGNIVVSSCQPDLFTYFPLEQDRDLDTVGTITFSHR